MSCMQSKRNKFQVCSLVYCWSENEKKSQNYQTVKQAYQFHKKTRNAKLGSYQSNKQKIKLSLKTSKVVFDQSILIKRQTARNLTHSQHQQLFDYLTETGKDLQSITNAISKIIQQNSFAVLPAEKQAGKLTKKNIQNQMQQKKGQQNKISKQYINANQFYKPKLKLRQSILDSKQPNNQNNQHLKAISSLFETVQTKTEYNTQRPQTVYQSFVVKANSLINQADFIGSVEYEIKRKQLLKSAFPGTSIKKNIKQARLAVSKDYTDTSYQANYTQFKNNKQQNLQI